MGSLKDAEISMVTPDPTADPPKVNVKTNQVTVWRPIADQFDFMAGSKLRGNYDDGTNRLDDGYEVIPPPPQPGLGGLGS
jgi:hypothetical protein